MREGKHLVIKGMVVFVTVCNFERWMADRVLSPSALAFMFQLDFDFGGRILGGLSLNVSSQ